MSYQRVTIERLVVEKVTFFVHADSPYEAERKVLEGDVRDPNYRALVSVENIFGVTNNETAHPNSHLLLMLNPEMFHVLAYRADWDPENEDYEPDVFSFSTKDAAKRFVEEKHDYVRCEIYWIDNSYDGVPEEYVIGEWNKDGGFYPTMPEEWEPC